MGFWRRKKTEDLQPTEPQRPMQLVGRAADDMAWIAANQPKDLENLSEAEQRAWAEKMMAHLMESGRQMFEDMTKEGNPGTMKALDNFFDTANEIEERRGEPTQ